MISLDDRKWKQFKLTDIFTRIKNGRQYSKRRLTKGNIPFAGASSMNNGITKFIQLNKNSPKAVYSHCIGIVCNGVSGRAYYYPSATYFSGDNVALFNPKLNQYSALFICTCIYQQHTRFEYGFKLRSSRFSYFKINLPINNKGQLDWKFMVDYIKQVRERISNKKIHNKINHSQYSLDSRQWKQFKIKDIGKVIKSHDYPKKNRHKGNLLYVGRTRFNNGVTDYITKTDNTPDTIYKNVIAVNRNGSTGYAFYHEYQAYFSGGVRVIKIKHLNQAVGLFLCTCIRQQRYQFNYGFELGKNRLENLKINLPVDSEGQPDWKFMNNYIKSMVE